MKSASNQRLGIYLTRALLVFAAWGYADISLAVNFSSVPFFLGLGFFPLYLLMGLVAGLLVALPALLLRRRAPISPTRVTCTMLLLASLVTINYWNYHDEYFARAALLKLASLLVAAAAGLTLPFSRSASTPDSPLRELLLVCGFVAAVSVLALFRIHATSPALRLPETALFLLSILALAILLLLTARARRIGAVSTAVSILGASVLLALASGLSQPRRANAVLTTSDSGRSPQTAERPNVIVIVLDTLRRDSLEIHGGPPGATPNLDRFASQALIMDHAWATSSWTLPSHASLFTGTYPSRHAAHRRSLEDLGRSTPEPNAEAARRQKRDDVLGLLAKASPMDPGLPTLAELLRNDGYQTAAVIANAAYLSRHWGLARGFDHYDDRMHLVVSDRAPPFFHILTKKLLPGWDGLRPARSAPQIVDLSLSWIGEHADRPFFLFVNIVDPHWPYFPKVADDGLAALLQPPGFPSADLTSDEHRRGRALYDGEVRFCDHHVGQLLDGLRRMQLFEDALIVITSDHGESFGEHEGVADHGVSLYSAETRIPLLIKYPNSARTGRSQAWVSLVDVMPAILKQVGIDTPETVEGGSLEGSRRVLWTELHRSGEPFGTKSGAPPKTLFGLLYEQTGEKVILNMRDETEAEVFDVGGDTREVVNLADTRRQLVDDARRLVTDKGQEVLARRMQTEGIVEPLGDLEERLRSLGYLGGESGP